MFTSYPTVEFPISIERLTNMMATRKTGSSGLPLYIRSEANTIKIIRRRRNNISV